MSAEDFVWGFERSGRYTLIEIAMFEGRSAERRHSCEACSPTFVTMSVSFRTMLRSRSRETPRANWGIRGVPADESTLGYTSKSKPAGDAGLLNACTAEDATVGQDTHPPH